MIIVIQNDAKYPDIFVISRNIRICNYCCKHGGRNCVLRSPFHFVIMNTRSVQRTLLASSGLKALPVGALGDMQGRN